jgi:alpha-galactosidase
VKFAADRLPTSLQLDGATGIITGAAPSERGEYDVTVRAANARGSSRRAFKIVVGDRLALTPPMGWNHWYTFYDRVSDELFRGAADKMIDSGMADFGYQYVNIDDCWMVRPDSKDPMLSGPQRDSSGAISPRNKRFPDVKALTAYIHSKG